MSSESTRSVFRVVAGAAATVLIGVVLWIWLGSSGGEARERGSRPGEGAGEVEVEVQPVASRTIEQRISSTGTLVAPESVVVTTEVQARVEELRFREGSRVEKGDVLVLLESGREEAGLAEARARVDEMQRELARAEALRAKDFASEARVDEARTALARARAELASATEDLADRRIEAPFAGVTGRRLVSPGAYLAPGDPVTRLVMTDVLDLHFEVPGNQLGLLREGLRVRARTDAYPGRVFEGEVRFVGAELEVATRSLALEASLGNEEGLLKPGMFMEVDLVVRERDASTVPEAAVVSRGPASFVFVVEDGSTVRRVPVELGIRRSGWVEILEGLEAGELVVVSGLQKVRDGTRVETKRARP